ncbi:MAG: beta-lactamase family protein [Candidatus Glassbacteria bacterium]|nr:beta-lactamase family protein [Candidatus Glassbacteria bacterium]
MKKPVFILVPALLVSALCVPKPAAVQEQDRGIFEMLYLHVKSKMKISYDCSAGAALVMRDGKVIYEEYLGATGKGPDAEPVNAASRWPYYSVSKEFGSALLLNLVYEGRLGLDDPVCKYLDYFTGPGPGGGEFLREKVTLRQLASHTSGVTRPRGTPQAQDAPPFSDVALEFEPGTDWHYNELGMKILGHVMAKVGGKPYGDLLKARILEPLGLETVGWIRQGDNLAGVVRTFDGPDSSLIGYTTEPYPGSGLYGTMRDILAFARLWLDGGRAGERVFFDQALIQEAWTDQIHGKKPTADTHYGLMLWLSPEVDAVFMAGASQTIAAILPDKNMVVLMGLNQYGGSPGWGRPPEEHSAVARVGHALAELLDK